MEREVPRTGEEPRMKEERPKLKEEEPRMNGRGKCGGKRRQGTKVVGSEGREQSCETGVSHHKYQLETTVLGLSISVRACVAYEVMILLFL